MKKLKSFTIIELMMGLLLTALATTITYSVFYLVLRQFSHYRNKSMNMIDYMQFSKVMDADVKNALVQWEPEKNQLILTTDTDSKSYFFSDSIITRTTETGTDSFHFANAISTIEFINDSIPAVSIFRVNIYMDDNTIPFIFRKEYTARELLNLY